MPTRCFWVPADDPVYARYHDVEWGFPVADDNRLFEKLSLEAFQSGLSWRLILGRRESFREAFAGFDPAAVADFGHADRERLLSDPSIVRNARKIDAVISNAAVVLGIQRELGSLGELVWRFEPPVEQPSPDAAGLANRTTSEAGTALAAELRRRGWRFVGPTTGHAFCQAVGVINDHQADCDTRESVERARAGFRRPGR